MGFAYIPPLDAVTQRARLHVRRFDPEQDEMPRWVAYEVPWESTMTVMQALEWLWEEGHYVAFRQNCREFTCGSCSMLINGRPALACDTRLRDGMRLEPLSRYPVVKDLVVNTAAVRRKWRELELWPHVRREGNASPISPDRRTTERYGTIFTRCIECYACLEACPASEHDGASFAGPMWMLQLARAREHPLDGVERLSQAWRNGLGECVNCSECQNVCPVGLSPNGIINEMRTETLRRRWRAWLGLKPVAGGAGAP